MALLIIDSGCFTVPPPCFAGYLNIVKMCFRDANIQMPQDHGIFEGEYNYHGVCESVSLTSTIYTSFRPFLSVII